MHARALAHACNVVRWEGKQKKTVSCRRCDAGRFLKSVNNQILDESDLENLLGFNSFTPLHDFLSRIVYEEI